MLDHQQDHALDLEIPVGFEPCSEFRAELTDDAQVCEACGWLADEHQTTITPLPRRAAFPIRRAS